MFEGDYYQFPAILERMLADVDPELDRREGSVIYDSLAPTATWIAEGYAQLDIALLNGFVETAGGDYIDLRMAEKGMTRRDAVKAQRRVTSNVNIPVGTRLMINNVFFVAVASAALVSVVEAEEAGTVGNVPGGSMTALDVVPGLTSAVMSDVLVVPGVERESDDSAKARYLEVVRQPSTSGNKADYRKWSLEVPGVGGVQVVPLANGRNTVRVYLIDADKRAVTPAVAQQVKDYIDPGDGDGEGKAPIGAELEALPGIEVPINVTADLSLATGYTLQQVYDAFTPAFNAYIKELAYVDPFVRLTRVAAILLGIPPIIDYANLKINGTTGNLQMGTGQVAVPGSVTFNVVTS